MGTKSVQVKSGLDPVNCKSSFIYFPFPLFYSRASTSVVFVLSISTLLYYEVSKPNLARCEGRRNDIQSTIQYQSAQFVFESISCLGKTLEVKEDKKTKVEKIEDKERQRNNLVDHIR